MAKGKLAARTAIVIECIPQGVPRQEMSSEQAQVWIDSEVRSWVSSGFEGNLSEPGIGNYDPRLASRYVSLLQKITAGLKSDNPEALKSYLSEAANFRLLIWQSRLGQAISKLGSGDATNAYRLAATLSPAVLGDLHPGVVAGLARDRAVLTISPSFLEAANLVEATTRVDSSRLLARNAEDRLGLLKQRSQQFDADAKTTATELSNYVGEIKAELETLKNLYHKQMQTEAAATYWEKKARLHSILGWLALVAFVGLVAWPFWLGWSNFNAIQDFLTTLTAATADKFSLTPVVALSIPVLAYGWILRHISRLFIQNLALADDASYRRVMSMTFLGLSKDPASGITEAERGIILNALFRPAPPNTNDEGPPAGLLEIIKSPKS